MIVMRQYVLFLYLKLAYKCEMSQKTTKTTNLGIVTDFNRLYTVLQM